MEDRSKTSGYAVTWNRKYSYDTDEPYGRTYYVIRISEFGQVLEDHRWEKVERAEIIASYDTIDECWAYIDALTDGPPPALHLFSHYISGRCIVSSGSCHGVDDEPSASGGPIITLTDLDEVKE